MNLFLFNLFTEIAISTKNMKIDCNPTQSNKPQIRNYAPNMIQKRK